MRHQRANVQSREARAGGPASTDRGGRRPGAPGVGHGAQPAEQHRVHRDARHEESRDGDRVVPGLAREQEVGGVVRREPPLDEPGGRGGREEHDHHRAEHPGGRRASQFLAPPTMRGSLRAASRSAGNAGAARVQHTGSSDCPCHESPRPVPRTAPRDPRGGRRRARGRVREPGVRQRRGDAHLPPAPAARRPDHRLLPAPGRRRPRLRLRAAPRRRDGRRPGIRRRVVLHFDELDAVDAVARLEAQVAAAGVGTTSTCGPRLRGRRRRRPVRGELVLDLPPTVRQSDSPDCDNVYSTKRFTPDLPDRS